jgi:hypothetical protein
MGFLDGLISPLITQAASARAAYRGGQQQGENNQLKDAIQLLNLKRQQESDARAAQLNAAQIGHLGAQTKSLDEGAWGTAFPSIDPDDPTKQILVQQHKQTGALRRATLGDPSAPTPAVASAPPKPPADGTTGGTISDSQDMTGGAPDATPAPQSSPPTVAQDSTPKPVRGGLRPVPKVPTARPASMIPGTPEWIAAEREKAKIGAEFRAPPSSSNVYITGVDSTGKPTIYTGKSKGDPTLTNTNVGKPVGTGGGSASLSQEDRDKMKAQAQLDNQTMKDFEAKILADPAHFNVGMTSGIAGSLAGGHGSGVLPGVLAAVGNTMTGAINPEYQKYITAQRSYGRIMGNLQSKRYSDNQAEIERSISGLGANDLPATIRYKQQLRDASLADPAINPTGGGRAGGGGSSLVDQYNAAVAHLKATGRDAEIANLPKPPGVP